MKKFLNTYYFYFPLILMCLFYVYKATKFPIHDFSNYYFGGKLLIKGNFNPSIYFPYEFNKAINDLGQKGIFASYAPNTPFLAFFFIPISLLPIYWAKLIFNCITMLLFIWAIKKLFHHYAIDKKWLLLLPLLFFVPIKNNILFGQVYFLIFYLLTEFWLHYEKGNHKFAGFILSFAILLKVSPFLLVFIFLFKKEYKPLLYTLIFSSILIGISLPLTGIEVWGFWLQNVFSKASNGEIATAFVDNYQSVFMFLKRLFVYQPFENENPWFSSMFLFGFFNLLFKLILLGIGYFVVKQKDNLHQISYWILVIILISPYGSTYTFLTAIFSILIVFKSDISIIKKGILSSLLFLVNNLPITLFLNSIFPLTYVRLLLFLVFVCLFLNYFIKLNFDIKKIVTLCFLTFILSFISSKKEMQLGNEHCKNIPILIYDFKIESNVLTYFYWNENGENSRKLSFRFKETKHAALINNQVYYQGKQLTFDNGNKKKPLVIDNSIIFLSDYDRGIGFYTLRKINIP